MGVVVDDALALVRSVCWKGERGRERRLSDAGARGVASIRSVGLSHVNPDLELPYRSRYDG